jgi:CheY-like chemotaxis protein
MSSRPWQQRFGELLPHRVREILLVSSKYDAFVLEEDGPLGDRLYRQYSALSLSSAPRITHADTAAEALRLIDARHFDLVLTVVRVRDIDAIALSERVKSRHPELSVVLLLFDETDLNQLPDQRVPPTIDRAFQWTGSAEVLIAAIKSIEDQKNAAHDTEAAGVQVLLVVEDGIRAYSTLLGLLYPLLLRQAGSLIAEGLNDFHRALRLRARPKILLAQSYEDALDLFSKFEPFVLALITDLRLPRGGVVDPDAGLALSRRVRDRRPDLAILHQTAEPRPAAPGVWQVDKNASDFRAQIRRFFEEALGFGDFVFRLPNGAEVGRARDVYEMERVLPTVPAESILYHASHNHFSVWLTARSLFTLAERLRPQRVDDFDDIEDLRREVVALLRRARLVEQESVISDLATPMSAPEGRFVRVGRGSIGGKGRSLAFVSGLIVRHQLLERYPGLQVRIPKTVVLGTEAFDAFLDGIDRQALLGGESDAAITARMLAGPLPAHDLDGLRKAFAGLKGPLAVRSSSLLEDSRFQPFAGVYATYMLPNDHPDPERRFAQLCNAIKAVYASTFWRSARRYLAGTPHEADDQKMAVVIQQVVGRRHEDRFYPVIAGVAQSYNHYAVAGQRPEDGVAELCLGLGHQVVGGGVALRFSPGSPTSLPQLASPESFVDESQRHFFAVDLSRRHADWSAPPDSMLVRCDLDMAERDGTLGLVASVYCPDDGVFREGLHHAGPRVVTFANVLKWRSLPLAEALGGVMALLRENMGEEVEIEIAIDAPVGGVGPPQARLYLLQVRPHVAPSPRALGRSIGEIADEALYGRTDQALGHGVSDGLADLVVLRHDALDARAGRRLIGEISRLDAELRAAQRPYALVGPGRWGSADPTLGVGVTWGDIAGAKVIVETPLGERRIEPSQGTHFFRNITAARVTYLTITDHEGSWLDLDAIAADATVSSRDGVLHFVLPAPIRVYVDGSRGQAAIVRPGHDVQGAP